jgi:hypothetical protein
MWVAELQCVHGHGFEGWFGSRDDYEVQRGQGLVSCPTCGTTQVDKRLSAPRLNLGAPAPGASQGRAVDEAVAPMGPAQVLRELMAQVKAHTEDVGPRFADEARRIHADEAPARAIRGRASAQELQALQDEGIEAWSLPSLDVDAPSH